MYKKIEILSRTHCFRRKAQSVLFTVDVRLENRFFFASSYIVVCGLSGCAIILHITP